MLSKRLIRIQSTHRRSCRGRIWSWMWSPEPAVGKRLGWSRWEDFGSPCSEEACTCNIIKIRIWPIAFGLEIFKEWASTQLFCSQPDHLMQRSQAATWLTLCRTSCNSASSADSLGWRWILSWIADNTHCCPLLCKGSLEDLPSADGTPLGYNPTYKSQPKLQYVPKHILINCTTPETFFDHDHFHRQQNASTRLVQHFLALLLCQA